MRVTSNLTYSTYINDIMKRQEAILNITRKLASGKGVNEPSDDPAAAESIISAHGVLSGLDQYSKNIDSGLEYLTNAEQALNGVQDVLGRIRELATSGATNTLDATAKANIAKEVRTLYDHMIALSNGSANGEYLFSGFKTGTAAFTSAGVYQGDTNKRLIAVGDNATLTIGVNGGDVFSGASGGVDVFQEVADLITALQADNLSGIQAAIGTLETAHGQISDAISDIGANSARLQATKDSAAAFRTNLLMSVSQKEDADVTKLIYELKVGQSALEASISAANNVLSIDIFKYI